ncbi:hypothetical protein C1A_136 [Wolbachia endosymbiont of Culex quinquefasciatus JHB]|uniref:hypothetical protein n=1 Tax=unclassified Wolbachia TaxID=2640676 RepID=UPI0001761DA1|nr:MULTISPECIES: hypothetical protein [unclassified Wolbachia]EEB55546.1 hypothetical protein C1A_136 [Wolbachia endosymbiont of Culex quinquefasciatus JHB]CAQ54660.1 hypothetical protein WP0552 [Wolbachia endosymbiont of Culex quinquefasciatus Pel]CQD08093.1 Ankyrin repeat domain protein [Wolbachia endosymbiont wPip_Mol of Culex molestus]
MLAIIERYNKSKESTHFTKLKAGGRFAIYALGIYLAATVTIGCLGLIIGSTFLTLPLAMLIFHPVAWILMGIVLTATYKMVIEPLFYLVKDYVDGKGIIKEEKSEEKGVELREQNPKEPKLTSMDSLVMLDNTVKNGELIKSQSLDSGLDVISRKTDDSDKRVRRNSYSPSTDSGVSMGSIESEQPKQTKIVRYNTTGDGNCFFHAVFGDSSSGQYKAERAQDMRMEWNKFLSQFKSLGDSSMPTPLKEQLEKVFNMFLNKPGDLTGKSDKIRKLVEQMNKEIKNAEDNVEKLVSKAVSKLNISRDQAIHNLKEYAEALYGLGENEYNTQYNSEFITQSFLNKPELYQAYLEAIKSQSYFIFIEEISILASLANIEINVYYKDNNSEEQKKFEPNLQMINDDQLNQIFNRESYKLNDELWGDKKQETIYLTPGHYERCEVVEVEPSLIEKVNSFVQDVIIAACNSVKNAFSSD